MNGFCFSVQSAKSVDSLRPLESGRHLERYGATMALAARRRSGSIPV
jgi:hypothetical protein